MWGRIIVPSGMSDVDALLFYCATTGAACRFAARAGIAELAAGTNLPLAGVRSVITGPYFSAGDVVLLTPAGLKAAAALMGPIIARSPAATSLGFVWSGTDHDVALLAEIIEDLDHGPRCARAAAVAPPETSDLREQVQRDLDAARRSHETPASDTDEESGDDLVGYDPITYRGVDRARPVRLDYALSADLRGRRKLVAGRDLPEPLRSLIIAAREAGASDVTQYVWPSGMNGRDTWTVGTDLADLATATAAMDGEGVLYAVTPDRDVVVFAPIPPSTGTVGEYRAPSQDDGADIDPRETDTSVFDAEVARVDRIRRHSLLTKEIIARLPKIRATENVKDPIAQVKFFSATHGFATWYLTEYDPKTGEGFGWATLGPGLGELGYIDVRDLALTMSSPKIRVGGRVLGGKTQIPAIERDLYWSPRPLSQAICEADPDSSASCDQHTRKPYDPADLDAIREFNEPAEPATPTAPASVADAFATAAHAVFDGIHATVLAEPVVVRGGKIVRLSASFSPNWVLIPGASGVASFSVSGYPADGPVGVQLFEVEITRPTREPDAPIAMVRVLKGREAIWTTALWLGDGKKPASAATVPEMVLKLYELAVDVLREFADPKPADDVVQWTIVQSGDTEISSQGGQRSWWRATAPEPADLTQQDVVKLLQMRRRRDPATRVIPGKAHPEPKGGWRVVYDAETDQRGYEGAELWVARLYDGLRPLIVGIVPLKDVVDAVLETLDTTAGGSSYEANRAGVITRLRTLPGAASKFETDLTAVLSNTLNGASARPVVNAVFDLLNIPKGSDPSPTTTVSDTSSNTPAVPTRKISGSRTIPTEHTVKLTRGALNAFAEVSRTEVAFHQQSNVFRYDPDTMLGSANKGSGLNLQSGFTPVHPDDLEKVATWVSVITATPTANGQNVRLLFGGGIYHRAIIRLDQRIVTCALDVDTERDVPFSVFVPTPPAVVQVGEKIGQHLRSWQVEAIAIMLRFLGHDGLDNSEGDSATPAADPVYRTIRDGASPSEIAMVAAANALVVPLGQGDATRFKVMEFTKQAMEALDRVRHDPVTVEIVRRKIGEAQVRAGLQPGGDGDGAAGDADNVKAALQRRLDRQEAALERAAPPAPITSDDIAIFQGKRPFLPEYAFVPSYSTGEYIVIWRFDVTRTEDRWCVVHSKTSVVVNAFDTAVEAFNFADRVKDLPISLGSDGRVDTATSYAFQQFKDSLGENPTFTGKRRDGAPPAGSGRIVILRHALLRSPALIAYVRASERAGIDLFTDDRMRGIWEVISRYAVDNNDVAPLAGEIVARLTSDPDVAATGWARDLPTETRRAVRSLVPFVGTESGYAPDYYQQVMIEADPPGLPSLMGSAVAVATDGHALAIVSVPQQGALLYPEASRRCVAVTSLGPITPTSGRDPFIVWSEFNTRFSGPMYAVPDIDMKAWAASYELPVSDVDVASAQAAVTAATSAYQEANQRIDARIAALRKEATPLPKPWRLRFRDRVLDDFRTLKLATEKAHEHLGAFFMFKKAEDGIYYGERGDRRFQDYQIEDLSADARVAFERNKTLVAALEAERAAAQKAVSDAQRPLEVIQALEKVPPMSQRAVLFRGGDAYIGRIDYATSFRVVRANAGVPGEFAVHAEQWVRAVEFVGDGATIEVGDSVVRVTSASEPRRQVIFPVMPKRRWS